MVTPPLMVPIPTADQPHGGGAILTGQSYSVSVNNGFTPPDSPFLIPWDTTGGLPFDPETGILTLPEEGIYAATYEIDFDTPAEAWHWYALIQGAEGQAPAADGDLLTGAGNWERRSVFGSGVVRISGDCGLSLRLALSPDPAAESPTLPSCSYAELDISRIV